MHDSILFTALWNLLCTAFCAEGDYRSADSVLYNSVLHDIIHNGKTMLTFLDTSKDYKLYDEQNRVVTTKKGDELYTHYDKVESSVRERYEKVQKEQKKTTKKKTVTTRKER